MWYKTEESANTAYDKYLERALSRFSESAFYAKSHQKECLDDVRHCYEILTSRARSSADRAFYNQQEKVLAELEAVAEKKYGVGCCYVDDPFQKGLKRRTEIGMKAFDKMLREWDFPDLHNIKERHYPLLEMFNIKDQSLMLLELRNEIKDAPIYPKPKKDDLEKRMLNGLRDRKYADRPFIEAATAIYKEIEPEEVIGFRSQHYITAEYHTVQNYAGTVFDRAMYFLNGKREALDVCMSYVIADFEFWLTHGRPDMSSWDNVYDFYKEAK
jgi:hypothetical protein